jgi:hypothetical protein
VFVDARIEDRAGNNLRRLFDEDVQAGAGSGGSHVELPFSVGER